MWLIAGLGNPGSKYEQTRHNIGFMVIDELAKKLERQNEKNEHKSIAFHGYLDNQKVILAKPQTFMNLSGEAIQPLLNYYKISLENMIIIHDDVDLPFGVLKLQKNRGHGGNNGIRDIHAKLGTKDYLRVKFGVDSVFNKDTGSYVLQNFSKEQTVDLPYVIESSINIILKTIQDGWHKTASVLNKNYLESNEDQA